MSKYECDVCEKSFSKNSNLTRHKEIHSSVKKYKCRSCKKRFKQKSGLYQHERLHDRVARYKCKICDKKFKQNGTLYVHMKTNHSKPVKQDNLEIRMEEYIKNLEETDNLFKSFLYE